MSEEEIGDEHGLKLSFFIIPEGLDFVNQFMIVLLIALAFVEIVYLISPQTLKKKIQSIDFDPKQHKISYTGATAIALVIAIAVTQAQLVQQGMSHSEKLELSVQEKAFRYRQTFFTEITLFVMVMQASVFLTLNHSFSVNRKRSDFSQKYKELMGKEKANNDKKDD